MKRFMKVLTLAFAASLTVSMTALADGSSESNVVATKVASATETTYVNLRESITSLSITPVWDGEFQAATLFYGDVYLGSVFVGDDYFYQYFSDEEFYITELALPVYNSDGTLRVGADFIAMLTQLAEQLSEIVQ